MMTKPRYSVVTNANKAVYAGLSESEARAKATSLNRVHPGQFRVVPSARR